MIPTKPGFYWRTGPVPLQENEGSIEQIVAVGPLVSTAPEELFFWMCGEMGAIFIQELPNVTWAGPIPDSDTIANLLQLKVAYEHIT